MNDTWIWNGRTWKQIQPDTVPPNGYGFGMDYDAAAKILVMFGGRVRTVPMPTWLKVALDAWT